MLFTDGYKKAYITRMDLQIIHISRTTLYWLILVLLISYSLKVQPRVSRSLIVFSILFVPLLLIVGRAAFYKWIRYKGAIKNLKNKVLLVGWNPHASRICEAIDADKQSHYAPIGYLQTPSSTHQGSAKLDCLGNLKDLESAIKKYELDSLILTDLNLPHNQIVAIANLCEKHIIDFKITPAFFEVLAGGLDLELVHGSPVIGITKLPLDHLGNRITKRIIDLIGGFVGCMLSIPIIVIFGTLVYFESPGPIFYRQKRVGYKGKSISVTKIRTMRLDAEKDSGPVWAKKNDTRVLKIGTFMRKYNLDEVPQFFTVMTGNMSLVGPRPERPELIAGFEDIIPHYHARHNAIPGLSGWAQINGLRGDTSIVERIRYDVYYLEKWSIWLDFYIMIMTFFTYKNAC